MPYPPPNRLQRFLTISNARIIYSHEGAARRNQDVLATDGVMNVFPNQSPDKTRQIGVQLLLQHRRNKPPSFDLILGKRRISLSAKVFRFFLLGDAKSQSQFRLKSPHNIFSRWGRQATVLLRSQHIS
jgi:hypothetical protein